MGCNCGGARGGRSPIRGNMGAKTVGRLASNTTPKNPAEMRQMAAKKTIEQQLSAQQKVAGGMDKNRREIERKRRLMILSKLGKL